MENRPFFVAMLKYAYLLSNKACHRTALEIVKMLLVLDPSDPLALLAVVDTLGLRSREHEWMIYATEYFIIEREGDLMYNIKYSLSLANFHVATKTKGNLISCIQYCKKSESTITSYQIKLMSRL